MIMAGGGTFPSEKFLDFVGDAVDVSGPDRVIPARHLDKARPGNFLSEPASRRKLYPGVGGPVDHEGRHPNARERMTNIDLGIHSRERHCRRWADRQAFEAGPPRLEARIVGLSGRECSERGAGSPRPLGVIEERRQGLRPHHGRMEMGVTAVKHERPGPFRIGCGKQNRHRGAFGGAKQRRTAAAGRIHDGANIVHPGFEVWQIAVVDPVAEAGASLVELDESCKGAEPLEQVAVAGVFPVNFEIGKKSRHENEIDRTVADHLIGDPHIAAAGISGLRRFHMSRSKFA